MSAEMRYGTKEEVLSEAQRVLNKSLRSLIPEAEAVAVQEKVSAYGTNRKGLLGDLVEQILFGLKSNSRSEADFKIAGVELKTTPLKRDKTRKFVAKERLVFSMIDYDKVVDERWETSSFLEKNKLLLLMFYLFEVAKSPLDYEFEFIRLFDLLKDISDDDIAQIRQDWEFIVNKIKNGEAHLLSEADTYYLGACTKAQNNRIFRDQPKSRVPAKPRAFSFKQPYLNYIIQRDLLGNQIHADSILQRMHRRAGTIKTIDQVVREKFSGFIGKTDKQIMEALGWKPLGNPKNLKRLLANRILGVSSNRIEELEKANITLRVITLEYNGSLKESISFPAFDYKDLVTQVWYDDDSEEMSDFHAQLETKKFLFVVFQKIKGSKDVILKKTMFWNFPMSDMPEAKRVWEKTVDCVNAGDYTALPKIKGSLVAHVRPHGADKTDLAETPQGTKEMKRCFWLNAKYIQGVINKD